MTPDEMRDAIADAFGIPRDVAAGWDLEGKRRQLHRWLWVVYVLKLQDEIWQRLTRELLA